MQWACLFTGQHFKGICLHGTEIGTPLNACHSSPYKSQWEARFIKGFVQPT